MENMLDKALKVARSDTVKASGKTLFKDIIGILMHDPNAAWSMLEDVKKLSSTIRDGIFLNALKHIFYIPIGIMKKQINLNRKICSHLQRL